MTPKKILKAGTENSIGKKLFGRVENTSTANTIINQTALLYLALGIIMVVLAIAVSPVALVDAVVLGVLALLVYKLRAKWVAGVMMGYAVLSVVGAVLVRVGAGSTGGSNIFLAIFVLWMSIRCWQATSFLVSSKK